MTPSTTLTLEGFLRGLQAEIAALIGAVILILIVLLLARWLINQRAANRDVFDATSARSLANKIAGIVFLLVLVGFAVNAATYASNVVPRSDLDGSSIYRDMDSNIKR